MEFNQLRNSRVACGYSQLQLSVVAQVSPAMIVAVEKYGYMPGPWVRSKLAKALGVSAEKLWPSLADTSADIKGAKSNAE